MTDQPVVRLFRCRPLRLEFDSILRDRTIPDLARLAGLVDIHVGRHGPDSLGERLIASIWTSRSAMADALGTDIEASRLHPEYLAETTDRSLEVLPLAIVIDAGRAEPPRIMRVVEGTVADGDLASYVAAAEAGTRDDIASGHGPLCLYLATIPPDRFITISIWSGWPAIEASTGAGTKRPEATRHADRLAEARVDHYEIVPG